MSTPPSDNNLNQQLQQPNAKRMRPSVSVLSVSEQNCINTDPQPQKVAPGVEKAIKTDVRNSGSSSEESSLKASGSMRMFRATSFRLPSKHFDSHEDIPSSSASLTSSSGYPTSESSEPEDELESASDQHWNKVPENSAGEEKVLQKMDEELERDMGKIVITVSGERYEYVRWSNETCDFSECFNRRPIQQSQFQYYDNDKYEKGMTRPDEDEYAMSEEDPFADPEEEGTNAVFGCV